MASLARVLIAQTEASAQAVRRRHQLVSGVVVRHDGGQVIVMVGAQSFGAQPALAQPLLKGDRVWVSLSNRQPIVIALQSRDSEAPVG